MRIVRSLMAAAGRCAAGLAGVLLVAAPAAPQSPVQVPITADRTEPNVGDPVTVRTNVLQTAPYNQHPGRYRVMIFVCVGTLERCRDRRAWQMMTARDDHGAELAPRRYYECTSGVCEVVMRLPQPREATVFARAVVHDLEDQGNDLSPPLAVRWVQPPPATPVAQQAVRATPTLTLAVSGASCTAHLGTAGNTANAAGQPHENRCEVHSPNAARIAIAANGSAPAPTVNAVLNGYPDTWSLRWNWWGTSGACAGSCAPTGLVIPNNGNFGVPPQSMIGRANVQVTAVWNGTEPRGTNPATGAPLEELTAIIAVDYVAP